MEWHTLLVSVLQGLCYIRTVVWLNTANMLSRQPF